MLRIRVPTHSGSTGYGELWPLEEQPPILYILPQSFSSSPALMIPHLLSSLSIVRFLCPDLVRVWVVSAPAFQQASMLPMAVSRPPVRALALLALHHPLARVLCTHESSSCNSKHSKALHIIFQARSPRLEPGHDGHRSLHFGVW